ncbi:3-hydroxyacyl-[acyl-carrier-protein] dehydratase FabZ [candidate division BRC1 bacterium HGW-BRC1-1]|jgi:3-hydroxyacyl-[acyl-carrier-protein] dehydratase|nr:MAG: 3-hydroxyacyl-[acyl-carrier-protein] dehydratase FabZ [candidate division BRC1 bacterium HGW-BRC1-1]
MSEPKIYTPPFGVAEICEILPHRWPFMLVDRIVEVGEKSIVGIKAVTNTEWFFPGHFPGNPVMPGVLQLEAMAQTGAVRTLMKPESRGMIAVLAGVDDARFRRMVRPGDLLRIEIEEISIRRTIGKVRGRCLVDGQLTSEATITYMVVSPDKQNG